MKVLRGTGLVAGMCLIAGLWAVTAGAEGPVPNPCSLLTHSEVAKLAPGVKSGKLIPARGTAHEACDWDTAPGIHGLRLDVFTHPVFSPHDFLPNDCCTVVNVSGVGGQAAAAFQNERFHNLYGLAFESDSLLLELSSDIEIPEGSTRFDQMKHLARLVVGRLAH